MLNLIKKIYLFEFRKEYKSQFIEYILLNSVLLIVPFLLGEPQMLIGTVVNAVLIYIAFNFKEHKLFPAIFLPSLATLIRGIIFGPFTPFLVAFIPFIWIANTILIFTARYLRINKHSEIFSLIIAGILKTGFLYLIAQILVTQLDFPEIFLVAMGSTQLITALCGGIIYLALNNFITKFTQSKL